MKVIDAAYFQGFIDQYKIQQKERINKGLGLRYFGPKQMQMLFDKMPLIDAEPVRHGRWINKKRWSMGKWHEWLECSECKYQDYNFETYEAVPFAGPSNYCPDCGAKMDLKD